MQSLRMLLGQIVALAAMTSACGTDKDTRCGHAPDDVKEVTLSPDVACAVAHRALNENPYGVSPFGCAECDARHPWCALPEGYVASVRAAADAGVDAAAGVAVASDGGVLACPNTTTPVVLSCGVDCTGRRTVDIADLPPRNGLDAGAYFAECAYLEETSIHAFARLAIELEAHGAPDHLVDAAKRAEVEEARHTEMMTALARRWGAEPLRATRPLFAVRPLLDIAIENAVEGCVRETCGAALALLRAELALHAEERQTLRAIAEDECNHARLSFQIADWATSRLSLDARAMVTQSMRAAIDGLSSADARLTDDARAISGTPPALVQRELVRLLDAHVFQRTATFA